MRTTLIASLLFAWLAATAQAASPEVRALTKGMDCVSFRLAKTNQRIRLSEERAIPGTTTVWALVNEGPSSSVIYASNGDRIPLAVFDGQVTMFTGDDRYSYSVGLRRSGAALVHICR